MIAEVHAAGAEDVDAAVKAARSAFNGPWRDTGGTARGALIYKLVELIERDRKTLATIEAWDNGMINAENSSIGAKGSLD